MMKPFPVLTRLYIRSDDTSRNLPVLPKEFLGRSAPRLREIALSGIPCPALPALLLSTSNLVTLELHRIPPTGYISPQAMATCLAALPRLDTFDLQFQSATPRLKRTRHPVTRILLPALTSFEFEGASEYLEDLVARIDSPRLDRILVVYLNQLVDFQVARLSMFIERLFFKIISFKHAQVTLSGDKLSFDMCRHEFRRDENHPTSCRPHTRIVISCRGIDWQVSHIAQVLSQFSATLSNVAHLKIEYPDHNYPLLEGADDAEWLLLLRQFSAVETLRVSRNLARYISQTLEDIPQEMVADVLPSLISIGLEGQRASSVEKFIAARRFSGQPIIVIDFKREMEKERARALLERAREKARGRVTVMKTETKTKTKTERVEDEKMEREREKERMMKRAKRRAIFERETARESARARVILEKERRMREKEPLIPSSRM